MGQGRGSAIGCIAVAKVVAGIQTQQQKQQRVGTTALEEDSSLTTDGEGEKVRREILDAERKVGVQRLCVVRDAGERVGRLARWEVV